MTRFVVDASVAAKWFLEETHSDAASSLLEPEIRLHAPAFLRVELDHVLAKKLRRDELSLSEASRIRQALEIFPIGYFATEALREPAFALAARLRRGIYDCLYLALALLVEAPMVTADRRFFDGVAAGPFAESVLWVEDLPAV